MSFAIDDATIRVLGFCSNSGNRLRVDWLGRKDSNLRMAGSKSAALSLGDALKALIPWTIRRLSTWLRETVIPSPPLETP